MGGPFAPAPGADPAEDDLRWSLFGSPAWPMERRLLCNVSLTVTGSHIALALFRWAILEHFRASLVTLVCLGLCPPMLLFFYAARARGDSVWRWTMPVAMAISAPIVAYMFELDGVRSGTSPYLVVCCVFASIVMGRSWPATALYSAVLFVMGYRELARHGIRLPTSAGALEAWRTEDAANLHIYVHCSLVSVALVGYALSFLRQELDTEKRRAEAAAEAKGRFLRTMSHEMRTPLNAVIGMSTLLLDSPLNAEQREMANTMLASSNLLLALINDVLDYAKIEAGKVAPEEMPVDVRTAAKEVLGMIGVRPGAVDKALWVDPAMDPVLLTDPTRLRQILANLASNAAKFTESGYVHISVGACDDPSSLDLRTPLERPFPSPSEPWTAAFPRTPPPAVPHAVFLVADSGIGIPPSHVPNLFLNPFSQADARTTRRFGGTGLGLTITARLVELLGGRVAVRSAEGRGTEFAVCLPLRCAGAGGAERAAELEAVERWGSAGLEYYTDAAARFGGNGASANGSKAGAEKSTSDAAENGGLRRRARPKGGAARILVAEDNGGLPLRRCLPIAG
ncbi:hypothetical protein DFJ74DRAFT_685612 [Hyaloraphidium curvatum]|nr:hypothetical protein DFJ74DRAFT_685612 [Hyaloraphidium curvatum]